MKMSKLKWISAHCAAAALVVTGTLVLPGCGGKEEPAPKAQPVADASGQGGESKAAKVAAETAKEIVAVKDALSLVPENADIALSLPAANIVLSDVVPFIDALAADVDLQAEIDKAIKDLAADLGVDGATSLDDIGTAKGLNFDEGVAVFLELSKTMADAKGKIESNASDTSAAEVQMDDLALPSVAVVASISDSAKVEEFLQGLATGELGLSAADDVDAGGITIKTFNDGHAYFIASDKVAISNDVEFLKGVAARTSNPAQLRYGTPECPKTNDDEVAMLIFGGNLGEDVKDVLPALALDPGMDAVIQYQMQMLDAAFGTGEGANDPIVTTLAWDDDKIELKSRVDTATHPGILTSSGAAGELKLAQVMPLGTQALVSWRFTPEFKQQIKDVILPMVADATGNDGIKGMGPQVIDQIGDELTIGITGAENDFPQLYLMLSLANPDATKSLLAMFVPQMEDQEHNGVMISTIAAPVPVPLSICYAGNAVLISNGVDGMKAIIDHMVAGTTSEFFAKLDPALDPAVPRYSGILLQTELITSIMPLMALAGGVPPEAEDIIGPLTETLKEVRILNEMNGDWSETKVSLYLKDAAAEAPAAAAEAPAATE